ncbi:MAG: hypothetical protein HGA45_39410, partial [Chloroflexales bacterium]|nr:hypothetical protein [Chloroflexales bacterium]
MTVTHSRALLVPTKLTAPQPLSSWVLRERLLARLGTQPDTRLTLVVAPAGFGKSTLVAQWLFEAQPIRAGAYAEITVGAPASIQTTELSAPPIAWLTLDEHDQDSMRFLVYVAGAITRVLPGALPTTLDLLAVRSPPPHVVLQALLVDLSALSEGLTLVIDDYHAVTAEAVHQTVAYLMRHLPPQCRLVLLSRVDPPLPLARLRADQQVTEVRAADLRFTKAETGALLAQLQGATPDAALVAALHEQTEGWAIALQLAALAQLEARAPMQALGVATRQLTEYLADEVFDQQPAAIQQALLAFAVPERFCAELCAGLLDTHDELVRAESLLDQLVRANLFLIPLDEDGRWYRFHHIFRDLLLRRLSLTAGKDGVRTLQLRAARWLAAEGLIEEAVHDYLAAGDEDAAAELIEHLLLPEMGKDVAGAPPGYWLRMLPAGLIARRPGLALIIARLSVFSMDMGEFEASLRRVDALLAGPDMAGDAPPWPSFQADLTVLQGVLCYWQGRPSDTISYMRSALEQGPTMALAIQALLQIGLSYVGNGAYAEGVRLIEAGLPAATARLGDRHALYQYTCLASMHQIAGELAAQARDAQRLASVVATRECGDLWVGYAASNLGLVAYERSDLSAAAAHFGVLASRKYRVSYPSYMSGVTGLALTAIARGAFAEAASYVEEAKDFADEAGGVFLRHQALGCATRVALARGDVAAALRDAAEIGVD